MIGTLADQTSAIPARRVQSRGSPRVWNGLVGVWGAVTGIAPHALHHVGPLAGTALVAGAGGQLLFGLAGLALSVPTLVRLRRRFDSWVAPGVALVIFAGVFTVSAFVVGPRISGVEPDTSVTERADHDVHEHTDEATSDTEGD